jgi:hypothetical protein
LTLASPLFLVCGEKRERPLNFNTDSGPTVAGSILFLDSSISPRLNAYILQMVCLLYERECHSNVQSMSRGHDNRVSNVLSSSALYSDAWAALSKMSLRIVSVTIVQPRSVAWQKPCCAAQNMVNGGHAATLLTCMGPSSPGLRIEAQQFPSVSSSTHSWSFE